MLLMTITKINKWANDGNISKLFFVLERGEDEELRKAAALSIGKLCDSSHSKVLSQLISQEKSPFVKKDMLSALEQIKDRAPTEVKAVFNEEEQQNLSTRLAMSLRTGLF